MKKSKLALWSVVLFALLPGLLFGVSCQQVSTQDIQGLLQAVQGKEMVITLSDGSTVRVTVDNAQVSSQAQDLVGKRVEVKLRVSGDRKEVASAPLRAGEDQKFTGTIETIGKDTWVIGGKTFKVDAATELDGGLRQGVTARVEFITRPDGTMLATEIETDEEAERLAGTIESISATQVKVGGKVFQVTPGTRIDAGLAAGAMVRVKFATQPDGSLVALRLEAEQDNRHFTGVIESIGKDLLKIGGQNFVVNQATRLDEGLAVGVKARVEFIKMADGAMVATEIQSNQEQQRFSGAVDSMSTTSWAVGGQTFKVNETTRIEKDVKPGQRVEVRFTPLPDGSKLASRIKLDKSGRRGGEGDDNRGGRDDGGRGRAGDVGDKGRGGDDSRGRGAGPSDNRTPAPRAERHDLHNHVSGMIVSIDIDKVVIGGQMFRVDPATMLDRGLAKDVKATVHFVTQSDGSRLALEIKADNLAGSNPAQSEKLHTHNAHESSASSS